MSLEKIFDEIEATDFAPDLFLASGIGLYRTILQQQTAFQNLSQYAKHATGVMRINQRIEELLFVERADDVRYQYDVAISVYILAITQHSPQSVRYLTKDNIDPSGLYWTRIAAQYLYETDAEDPSAQNRAIETTEKDIS